MRRVIPSILAALMLTACAVTPETPVSPQSQRWAHDATLNLPDMRLHDPFVIADKTQGIYYLYTSNVTALTGSPDKGVMVYKSRDLKSWSPPSVVFSLPSGIWANGGAWAPEVHAWKGKYYLFVTLHNEDAALAPVNGRKPYRRGTIMAVSDTPDGPFELMNGGEPVAPADLMTLDGTLYVDRAGKPWYVYSHEWLQVGDGTIEALSFSDDLKAHGIPKVLFKASDSPESAVQIQPDGTRAYVTDGPQFYRSKTGELLMLWSSWGNDGYIQTQARSITGELSGPWQQLPRLLGQDSGHGMLFETFDGQLMLIVHRPFKNARGKLYEMRDAGDHLEIIRQRTDLDGGN
ncbi:glycoside hydrolase family 43 protein [Asticcacaulis machinosus]|uniref:Glycoside hydrolase family 43 protein n=1 Tax=Asticcacaulis machinosus TaxID=2984211 RepID=A0ABT5HIB0_9CAUL|nr:glycoside hydrolase family 43 protein [Asticcacaulis machinosus]MDC7675942.1 glycoside hydrolase family 43 protein [Asticcacaulis machinosus]